MNTYTISLSSNNTSTYTQLDVQSIIDYSLITLDLDNVYSKIIPLFLRIDWGDGVVDTINNDIFGISSKENINIFNPMPVLNTPQKHYFYPSTTLYTEYTIQVSLYYSNGEQSIFIIPLKVISSDYHESIKDMLLVNVNILPDENNSKEYQILTEFDNQIVEFRDVG